MNKRMIILLLWFVIIALLYNSFIKYNSVSTNTAWIVGWVSSACAIVYAENFFEWCLKYLE